MTSNQPPLHTQSSRAPEPTCQMISLIRSRNLLSVGLLKRTPAVSARFISLKPDFSKLKKIDQPPGNIVGTVNDAYIPPEPNHYEGGYHWTYERMVSVALVPLLATPFVAGVHHPVIDATFCLTLLLHCHAGLKSCIIDYIPKRVFGVWHKVASSVLTLGTAVGVYGIYLLETTSNGVFDLLASLWVV